MSRHHDEGDTRAKLKMNAGARYDPDPTERNRTRLATDFPKSSIYTRNIRAARDNEYRERGMCSLATCVSVCDRPYQSKRVATSHSSESIRFLRLSPAGRGREGRGGNFTPIPRESNPHLVKTRRTAHFELVNPVKYNN